jgi:hypothetical protein
MDVSRDTVSQYVSLLNDFAIFAIFLADPESTFQLAFAINGTSRGSCSLENH